MEKQAEISEQIINSLSSNNCTCLMGFKSALSDQVFALTSIKLNIPIISQVTSVAKKDEKLTVKQSIFSGKANTYINLNLASIFILNPAFELNQVNSTSPISINNTTLALPTTLPYNIQRQNKETHGTSLVDATYVVGAGRGLKDPSNWKMIEELASKIGAATACSKPVSDINWRPHSEHVGQTGIKIAPQLYIACGISGAIQHLAGVNGSKSIIVINNDPEAPFFKYADYGIVGDVFDVVPEILKNL
jgi:electron transfer flavoprotein alpha subunit